MNPLPSRNSRLALRRADFGSVPEMLDYAATGETGITFYSVKGEILSSLSWREAPDDYEWQRDELVHYATTRRDALKALAQAIETHQAVWIERSRTLQVQADNILLQMRLRKSVEAAGR